VHAQGVNISLHHVLQRLEHHAMAPNSALSRKGIGNDPDLEVSFSIPRTCVACMQVTLILDQNLSGRKRILEKALYATFAVSCHGNTSLNGLTTTWR